ncbi:MAG TPA: FAD/NAD(P)-binding oxidoreductase [Verrucomicrobiae bacterium]|nr:FAD/NAD(P)-binding oxidoreductase [Verrucomicrobiae bacterium]
MSSSKYVILGGGMVAGYAAKEMVERGLKSGELTIISADDTLPYERPPLSKGFLSGKDTEAGILINPPDWYKEKGIEVKLQTVVEGVDLQKKRLVASSSQDFQFENLLIATGCRARRLESPGNNLANVFYLRSMDDSRKIRSCAANAKQAVVIGGGFIGMEVASVLAQKNIHTTMIVREDRVWERAFTPEMSAFFERYYTARGVQLIKHANVTALEGKKTVSAAVLDDRRKIPCDVVVAGVGAAPVTDLFAKTELSNNNGIAVNEYLETAKPGFYAAGDVANYPDPIFKKRRRVEHWDNAVSHGHHWARVILGDRHPFVHVPYFFSDVFDLSYELWGDSEGATQTVVRGEMESSKFSVWWLKQDRLVAAFVMSRPDEERTVAPEWIKSNQLVSPKRLADQAKAIQDAAA